MAGKGKARKGVESSAGKTGAPGSLARVERRRKSGADESDKGASKLNRGAAASRKSLPKVGKRDVGQGGSGEGLH